jgi:hypothetical protein
LTGPSAYGHHALAPGFVIAGRAESSAGASVYQERIFGVVGCAERLKSCRVQIRRVGQCLLTFPRCGDGGALESGTRLRARGIRIGRA